MLLRQKPKDNKRYLSVDSALSCELQLAGYYPHYLWNGIFYYIYSDELKEIIEERRNTVCPSIDLKKPNSEE